MDLQQNWKSILFLLDEAQFLNNDTPPKLDERMNELARKKPDYPTVKVYQRYRGGPHDMEIFSSNDIPCTGNSLYASFSGTLPAGKIFW